MAERLRVRGLRKFHGPRLVLEDVSFSVEDGEVLALLGPSGGGKTTTLNLIAGLDRPDDGEIAIGGETVATMRRYVPPERRAVGMVFQGQVLWPHMSVAEHLNFVLRARGVPRAERRTRIAAQLDAVQLTGRDGARPAELSGGEAQRLAIARALVARPSLLLFDEPCANLDTPLKSDLLALLSGLRAEYGFSAVYVTHDPAEAFAAAGRVGLLEGGRLVQVGTPEELCESPASPGVTRIVGGGALLPGMVAGPGRIKTAIGMLGFKDWSFPNSPVVTLFVRTEDLRLNDLGNLEATAKQSYYDGGGWIVVLAAGGVLLRARSDGPVEPGETVRLSMARAPKVFA